MNSSTREWMDFHSVAIVLLIPAYPGRALHAVGDEILALKLPWPASHFSYKQKNGRFQDWSVTKDVFVSQNKLTKKSPMSYYT